MKLRTKEVIGNVFRSFVSNQTAIQGAKRGPIWLTIIFFFLGVMLPVIPLTVSSANTYGSAFIGTYAYSLDQHITYTSLELLKDGYTCEVNNQTLEIKKDNSPIELQYGSEYHSPLFSYNHGTMKDNSDNLIVNFELYTSGITEGREKEAFVSNIINKEYTPLDITQNSEGSDVITYYHPSFAVFFPNGYYFYLYQPGTNVVKTYSSFGDFAYIEDGFDLLKDTLGVESVADEAEILEHMSNPTFLANSLDNWKEVLNKGYLNIRKTSVLYGTLIYLGIYTALSLFMGLMMFLLSRGKNNPNNYLSFPVCLGIESWTSVCPGLLAMVFGFLMSSYAVMMFIMFLGMRVMWLCMKELRPQYQ